MDLPVGAEDDAQSAIQNAEQEWDEAMQNARAMAGRQPGNQTGAFEELIDSMHDSVMDWRALLRQYMTTITKADFTFSRPNRRFISQGIYLPSMRSETAGQIVFAIDTSASMDSVSLAALWAEIRAAVADVEPESVVVVQCDTEVKRVDTYDPYSLPEQLHAVGRGGTAFKPVFRYLEQEGIRPCVMLFHTDMECYEFADEEPDFPVMWCKYGEHGNKPPFGEVLEIA